MNPKCIKAVLAAKKISPAKLALLESELKVKMRELARTDPNWSSLTRDERMIRTGESAMRDIEAAAARTEYNGVQQILKTAETANRILSMKTLSALDITQSQALVRDMQNTHNYQHTMHNEAVSNLTTLIDAAESKDGTGLLRNLAIRVFNADNPQMTADVVREVFSSAGGKTGNKLAKAAAESWLKTTEDLRLRFNAAGGDIGKLGYGYLTQIHDAVKISKVTSQKWAADVLPLLDRKQYLKEDGSLMNDAEILKVMESAHETLASNGLNKIEPGQFKGAGARANRGGDARVIHFKDGDGWIAYMDKYGEGTLYDAMLGHIGAMTKNIGLIEKYGPNPENQMRLQFDLAQRADGVGTIANRTMLNTPEAYWQIISGKTGSPENQTIARVFSDIRNIQTAAKLGSAVISSISDVGTIANTLHFNRLPYFEMLKNVGRNMKRDQREFLVSHGVIAENLTSTINRFTGDNLTHSLSGRVAAGVMKVSLMNAWTDGLRSAFSATMMQTFSKKAGTSWAKLDEWDRFLMGKKGITEEDWGIITKATPVERSGLTYLTHDSIIATGDINAQQAATKWAAFVSDEAQFAILNPDLAVRAIVTGGGMPAGTVRGEAMRTFMQFKSFPLSMLTRHWSRVFDTPQGLEGAPAGYGATTKAGGAVNQVATLAALNVSLMLIGGIALQIKSLLVGKDPVDMTMPKFWAKALSQGGGLGFVGDVLLTDPTENHGANFERTFGSVLGPGAGAVAGLAGDVIWTNAWQASQGKDAKAGAEALRWANSQLPGSNLWFLRGVWEHEFLHQAQESLNPGYLGRMRKRAMKDWGQDYYWQPGEAVPDRAPNMSAAFGR